MSDAVAPGGYGPSSPFSEIEGQFGLIPEADLVLGNHTYCGYMKRVKEDHGSFARYIHVITPGHQRCNSPHPDGPYPPDHLVVPWLEPGPLTVSMIKAVGAVSRGCVDDSGYTFLHCDAGLHRSTTLALVFLMARNYSLGEAVCKVTKAMWEYQTKVPPVWIEEELHTIESYFNYANKT